MTQGVINADIKLVFLMAQGPLGILAARLCLQPGWNLCEA